MGADNADPDRSIDEIYNRNPVASVGAKKVATMNIQGSLNSSRVQSKVHNNCQIKNGDNKNFGGSKSPNKQNAIHE